MLKKLTKGFTLFMNIEQLKYFDQKHIWHPYTSMMNPLPVYLVKSAEKCIITLENGKELIDGMSSWWAAIHGYNHPVLNESIIKQSQQMSHIMFGGITHKPAVKLAKKLIDLTPQPLDKVFFSDSGSVAVEVALKMALQYWYSKEKPEKNKFLTIKNGYHGDTFYAMSVCDPITGMHEIFKDVLPLNLFADQPQCKFNDAWDENDITSFKNLIEEHHKKIAAVILEPIVQGAGGMWFYSPEYVKQVRQLCHKYDVLLIFDEIATGFGRTGKLFALEHAGVCPDILCLGKAITGGTLSFAATLATSQVSNGISSGKAPTLMHGPTFMANPLACSVANASIDLLLSYNWQEKIKQIETQLKDELQACNKLSNVENVRVLGAIGVVQVKKSVDMGQIQKKFVSKGVWIRPFNKLIYIMPPYIIEKQQLSKLTQAIYEVVSEGW